MLEIYFLLSIKKLTRTFLTYCESLRLSKQIVTNNYNRTIERAVERTLGYNWSFFV